MEPTEPDPDSSDDVAPGPPGGGSGALSCAEALGLVRRFVAGNEQVDRRVDLRAHLARCVACREQYRSEVVLVARLARGGARELESVRRMESRARRALSVRPGRRIPLIRILLPFAGLCGLLAIAGPGRGGPALITSLAGAVTAAGATLEVGDEPLELARGNVCTTDEHTRARIEHAGAALVLEPDTAVLFERRDPMRLRLLFGRILVEGPATIETWAGILVALEGRGLVALEGGRVRVFSSAVGWRFEGAGDGCELQPGVLCERTRPLARAIE